MRAFYTAEQMAMVNEQWTLVREALALVAKSYNLGTNLVGGWLAQPSLLASPTDTLIMGQPSRLTLFSDGIMAPLGMGWPIHQITGFDPTAVIEMHSAWLSLGLALLLWLVGQVVTALYLRWAAVSFVQSEPAGEAAPPRVPRLGGVLAFVIVLGWFLSILTALFSTPIRLMLALTSAPNSFASALVGGIGIWLMMWFLAAFFFAAEAYLLAGQTGARSVLGGMALMRRTGFAGLAFIMLVNLIMLGSRAAAGLIGQTPAGAAAAIFANAFLATAMLLATFAYYRALQQQR